MGHPHEPQRRSLCICNPTDVQNTSIYKTVALICRPNDDHLFGRAGNDARQKFVGSRVRMMLGRDLQTPSGDQSLTTAASP